MNCNAHCRGCDRHFSSTSAFDRHRGGKWEDGRECLDPEGVERLYRYEGDCEIAGAESEEGVEIWSTKRNDA